MALSYMGLYDFVLTAPRTNIISANKEGIVSLTGLLDFNELILYIDINLRSIGYLAIHLLGLSTGTLVLPPSPSFFRRRQEAQARSSKRRRNSDPTEDSRNSLSDPRQNSKTATELCSYTVVWWCVLGLATLLRIGGEGVSRRMVRVFPLCPAPHPLISDKVNLTYILWVVAFNTSFILGYFLLDLYFFPSSTAKKSGHPSPSKLKVPSDRSRPGVDRLIPQRHPGNPPALLEAINKNALVLFLLVRHYITPPY